MSDIRLDDGTRLPVRFLGRGEPVLLLPGLGMGSAAWLPFVAPLAHRYRFILPELRGQGGAKHLRLRDPDPFESHARDLAGLVEALGLGDFVLGGISLGGTTSLHAHHRGLLRGVRRYLHIDQSPCVGNRADFQHGLLGVAQDTFFAQLRPVLDALETHLAAERVSDLPEPARTAVATGLSGLVSTIAGKPRLGRVLARSLALPPPLPTLSPLGHLDDVRAYLRAYLAGGHDYRTSLPTFPAPVTVFVGTRSPLYPEPGQRAIAELAPDGRVVRFTRSGHVPLVDEPRAFVRELGRFLAGDARGPRVRDA